MAGRTMAVGLAAFAALTASGVVLAEWPVPKPGSPPHPALENAPSASPTGYPNEEAFQKRAERIVQALAINDLQSWRRGYFEGGDPGKYAPGSAMAKLLRDPDAPDARALMNDGRSATEHYHFAAVNWARFLPIFAGALTPETKTQLAERAARFGYLSASGTENHRSMAMTSANVLPAYLEGDVFSSRPKSEAERAAKEQLRAYVKGLYAAGMGEWDSNIYHLYAINGMLNVYDFAKDPEVRLLAAAALDWMAAAYALKYRDGVFGGPNQRGYARGPVEKLTDHHGWLWWGSDHEVPDEMLRRFLYSIHPITSSWRPNAILSRIATKDLDGIPFVSENSKPNYWYGHGAKPRPGQYQETLYVGRTFSVGTLWNGFGSQITRFQIVAHGPKGGTVLTAGSPRKSDHRGKKLDELTFEDGGGRYDQWVQIGSTAICLTAMPDEEDAAFLYVSLPAGSPEPEQVGAWWVIRIAETLVAVRPLNGTGSLDREAAGSGRTILRFDGRRNGLVIEAADARSDDEVSAFLTPLQKAVFEADPAALSIRYQGPDGPEIDATHAPDAQKAIVRVDGEVPVFDPEAVYAGPFVRQKNGVLEVSDGRRGYKIDFRGELPVYSEMDPSDR